VIKRHGFTLVELLVVIAIISVLAALLFPVFQMVRAKAWEATCASNLHQLSIGVMAYAQDHGDVFPSAQAVWGSLNYLGKGVMICPVARTLPVGYVYSNVIAGKTMAVVKTPELEPVLFDGLHEGTVTPVYTYDNVAYSADDLAYRHKNSLNVVFADGHVEQRKDNRVFPLELRNAPAAQFENLDTRTLGTWWSPMFGFVYGHNGYVLCGWNGAEVMDLNRGSRYVQSVDATGATSSTWPLSDAGDARALVNPSSSDRSAACWQQGDRYNITLANASDNTIHTVRLYCLDYDSQQRVMVIDAVRPDTGVSIMRQPVTVKDFSAGVWVAFTFKGNISFTITGKTGTPVVSAFMFD